jgi:hypothetical protein
VDDATINPTGTDMIVAQADGTLARKSLCAIQNFDRVADRSPRHSFRCRRYRLDFDMYGVGMAHDVRFGAKRNEVYKETDVSPCDQQPRTRLPIFGSRSPEECTFVAIPHNSRIGNYFLPVVVLVSTILTSHSPMFNVNPISHSGATLSSFRKLAAPSGVTLKTFASWAFSADQFRRPTTSSRKSSSPPTK